LTNCTTFPLGDFEVFRKNLENAAKVPADMDGSTRSQGFLSRVLTKVDYGWPKGVIRVCWWCFRGDSPGGPTFDQSQPSWLDH
jgi:hypothetical protein